MLNTTRQSSALGLIVNDLNQARGEAIKRNARVVMCSRDGDGIQCATFADTSLGFNWHAGWLVCIAAVGTDTCAASTPTDPNPLIVRPPLDANLTLSGTVSSVRFNPNSSAVAANMALNGTWSGAISRTVAVAVTGNISK
jgi:Tfp pilus assembly protein FimT